MADLFDILNVNPAQSVQPQQSQNLMQTIAGRLDRNIQQAAGQDTRTQAQKVSSAAKGADTTTPQGLIAFAQKLDAVGESARAAQVRQMAAQKQRENTLIEEAKTQKEALSAFIADKYPDLAGISDYVTLQQATAYDTAQKAGETTELQRRMIDYFDELGQPDLAAGIAAGEPYTAIARESNDRVAAEDETGRVRQPTSSELDAARDIVEAKGVGVKDRWGWNWLTRSNKPTEAENTLLAMQLWTISLDNNVSLVEACDLLASRVAAAAAKKEEEEDENRSSREDP